MKTVTNRLYEAMFLVDSALASSDWDGVLKTIQTILKKAKAEVVSIRKWDDRRLAYDIKKKTRGTYILAYFHCDSQNVHEIERSVQLSEQLMRVLIIRADHVTEHDIQQETPAMRAEREGRPADSETFERGGRREFERRGRITEDVRTDEAESAKTDDVDVDTEAVDTESEQQEQGQGTAQTGL